MSRFGVDRLGVALAAGALAVAGCGGSSSHQARNAVASAPAAKQASTPTATQPATTPAKPAKHPYHEDTLPRPKLPAAQPGAKVDRLVVKDLVKGTGSSLAWGDVAFLTYAAMDYATGKPFGIAWGHIADDIGMAHGSDIPRGWLKGLPGMRAGGRRILIVPPKLVRSDLGGYADQRTPVYFVVDLLGVVKAKRSRRSGGPAQ